ncbi:hypothetical protein ACWGM0_15790 [Sphingomonas bisphenolicum]
MASMIPNILLAATAVFLVPAAPLDGQLNAAIWHDLEANAMIGNGDRLAALWANAGNEKALTLHIEQLRCRQQKSVKQCSSGARWRENHRIWEGCSGAIAVHSFLGKDQGCMASYPSTAEEAQGPQPKLHELQSPYKLTAANRPSLWRR